MGVGVGVRVGMGVCVCGCGCGVRSGRRAGWGWVGEHAENQKVQQNPQSVQKFGYDVNHTPGENLSGQGRGCKYSVVTPTQPPCQFFDMVVGWPFCDCDSWVLAVGQTQKQTAQCTVARKTTSVYGDYF